MASVRVAIGPHPLGEVELKAHVEICGVVGAHAVCRHEDSGSLSLAGEGLAELAPVALKDLFGALFGRLDLCSDMGSSKAFGHVGHSASRDG